MSVGLGFGGAAVILTSGFMLTFGVHWFPISMLLLGIVMLMVAVMRAVAAGEPPLGAPELEGEPQNEAADLPALLTQLEAWLEEGTLTKTEYNRKRRQLVDAWGVPEA